MKFTHGAVGVVLSVVLLGVVGCSHPGPDDRTSGSRAGRWDKTAGPAEVSAFMKVRVPEDAAETKGAVQINPQEDIYLLSFVTSEKSAERIARDLRSEEPLRARKVQFAPEGERFRHLGLKEPQTLKGIRWAGVCPPCVDDKRRDKMQWIEIYVQRLDATKARVYLQAF